MEQHTFHNTVCALAVFADGTGGDVIFTGPYSHTTGTTLVMDGGATLG